MAQKDDPLLTRRSALARLGLVTGAAYVSPVFMHLGAAHASGSGASGAGWSGGGSRSGPSGRGYRPSASHGSGPSGRRHDARNSTRRVVNDILGTLEDRGVIR